MNVLGLTLRNACRHVERWRVRKPDIECDQLGAQMPRHHDVQRIADRDVVTKRASDARVRTDARRVGSAISRSTVATACEGVTTPRNSKRRMAAWTST